MQLFPSRARSIDGQQQESDRVDKDGAMSGAPPTAPAVVKQHTFEAPQLGALSGDAGYEYGAEADAHIRRPTPLEYPSTIFGASGM
jgi:hypothetical protein